MIVLESSAMVDALVDEPANPNLLALLADEELHAPALLDFEVASALRGHVLGGKLDPVRLDLRDNFTVYDAAYLVLAQALEATVVTADAKLREAARLGIDVRVFDRSA